MNALNLTGNYSGVQFYIWHLMKALDSVSNLQTELTSIVSARAELQLENISVDAVTFDTSCRLRRIVYENLELKSYCSQKNVNVYHSLSYVLPFYWNLPSVITVHDLIALDYAGLSKNSTAIYYRAMLSRSIRASTKIIAVSNTVKQQIVERYNVQEEKIWVIPLGISRLYSRVTDVWTLQRIRDKYKLPTNFVLFVGNLEPKKNLVRLIRAFSMLRNKYDHLQLIIIGQKGWKFKQILKESKGTNLAENVRFLGYVSLEDLPSIYSLATLFVFPSITEGFGLPVLEAMACKTPVVASTGGALPEVTGGICPLADPYQVDDLFEKMLAMIEHEVYDLELAEKKAKQYTWEHAALETARLYDELE